MLGSALPGTCYGSSRGLFPVRSSAPTVTRMEIKQAGVPAVFAVRVASRQRTSRKGIEQRKFAALWSAGPDYAFVRDVSTPQKAVLGVLSMVVRYASGSVVLYPASVGNPAELLALADPRLVRHLE